MLIAIGAVAAIIGAVTNLAFLLWKMLDSKQGVTIGFVDDIMILTSRSRRTISIATIGVITPDNVDYDLIPDTFKPICVLPPKGQDYIRLTRLFRKKLLETAEYVYAQDVQGQCYRSKRIRAIDVSEVTSSGERTDYTQRASIY